MRHDPQGLYLGIDQEFRPATYFLPDAPPPPAPLPEELRDAIGRIHPSLMGGLYLPAFLPGEVEIARVELESVTADVISVRARPAGSRIAYRVVDEYENDYVVSPATSSRPLSLSQLTRLMDRAAPDGESPRGGVVLGAVMYNVTEGGQDPAEFHSFAKVSSDFYPWLDCWYERTVGAWLDAQVARRNEGAAEGSDHAPGC